MWTYPSDHQPRPVEAEPPQATEYSRPIAIVNLALAVAGIVLAWDGELRGALLVLIALAAFNAVLVVRR